jgi:hypothetical protein
MFLMQADLRLKRVAPLIEDRLRVWGESEKGDVFAFFNNCAN